MYGTSDEAKKAGWHSRKHETREAQDEAKVKYHRTSGKAARQAKAFLRNIVRIMFSSSEGTS